MYWNYSIQRVMQVIKTKKKKHLKIGCFYFMNKVGINVP